MSTWKSNSKSLCLYVPNITFPFLSVIVIIPSFSDPLDFNDLILSRSDELTVSLFSTIKSDINLVIELKDVIDFNISLKICKGTIKNIDFNMPTNTVLKEKPVGYSSDFYFNQLVENENYEELNNLYGIDEIEKNSNLIKKR